MNKFILCLSVIFKFQYILSNLMNINEYLQQYIKTTEILQN